MASRADVCVLNGVDSRLLEGTLYGERQVKVPATHDIRAETLAVGSGYLLPHLVAAGSNRRSYGGGEFSALECGGAALHDSIQQPLPAHVQ